MPHAHAFRPRTLIASAMLAALVSPSLADHPSDEAFYEVEIHEWVVAQGASVPANAASFHANSAGQSIFGHGAIGPVIPIEETVTIQLVVEGHLHRHVEEGAFFDIAFDALPTFNSGQLTMVSAAMEATGETDDMLHHTLFTQGAIGPIAMEANASARFAFTTSPFAESLPIADAQPHDGNVLGDFIFIANFEWSGHGSGDLLGITIPDDAFRITYVPVPGTAACAATLAMLALRRRR